MNFSLEITLQIPQLAALTAALLKASTTVTQQFDTLTAQLDAAIAASAETNAANAKLIGVTNEIKSRLDAVLAAGTGMSSVEVQTLLDKMAEMTLADNAAKAATDATVTADTPAPAPV